jgi:hypothetical protein
VLVTTGPVLAHVTARSMLIRRHDGWEAGVHAVAEEEE